MSSSLLRDVTDTVKQECDRQINEQTRHTKRNECHLAESTECVRMAPVWDRDDTAATVRRIKDECDGECESWCTQREGPIAPSKTSTDWGTQRLYICSHCGRDFVGEREMESHEQLHKRVCAFGVEQQEEDACAHTHTHTPFTCSHCGKGFGRRGQLKRHTLIHSAQKAFGCSGCEKRFANKWQLSAHEKIHSGEKPFCCSFCDKRFIRKGELTVHLKRHTGDKPFHCSYCGKGFTTKGEVNIHQRRHAGDQLLTINRT